MASRNRGKKKPSLRELIKINLDNKEMEELWGKFNERQTPIVTAVLGQALVENELDQLLRPHFAKRDDETWETLTDVRGPPASFSTKIITAHAFGIFNEKIKDCLETIRKIRNTFAHSQKVINFSHELIVKELRNVPIPKGKRTLFDKVLADLRQTTPAGAEESFLNLCVITEIELTKVSTRRSKAKIRRLRLSKKYRHGLAQALLNYRIEPQEGSSLGPLDPRSDNPTSPPQKTSEKKPQN